jgi:molecular chaperone IbpA
VIDAMGQHQKLERQALCGCLCPRNKGFDRCQLRVAASVHDIEAIAGAQPGSGRPYNIERTGEDEYRISLALAGFMPEEITLTAEQNMLTVEGHKAEKGDHQYLYQGISARSFRRQFNLADYVEVKGASFENGLLQVTLVRELPEGMKPRRIAITAGAGNDNQQVQHKEAA